MHDGQINLNITAPKSWRELSQDELRYTLFLLTRFQEPLTGKTYRFRPVPGGWQVKTKAQSDLSGDRDSPIFALTIRFYRWIR